MTMKRRVGICAILWMCFSLMCSGSALAQENMVPDGSSDKRVYDMADLLIDEEEHAFEEQIEGYRDSLGFDIVVVTTEDAQWKEAQEYADDFYEAGDFGAGQNKSGILFLIDMDNRELALSTNGTAIRIFTDDRIEHMLDDVYDGASRGEFDDSVEAFLQDVSYYGQNGIQTGQYNFDTETGKISVHKSIQWHEALFALIVAAFVAGGACLTVKKQYNMEASDRQKNSLNMAYRADCSLAYGDRTDHLVNKFVTSRVIPKSTGGGRSSGSRSSGGRSSAGRSSTHRSSSGRSHGGGSRRF